MKICIVGAGAIGGMIAARLAHVGHEVTVIVRGANLEAVRRNGGMKLIGEDGTEILGPVGATDSPAEAGTQDCVSCARCSGSCRRCWRSTPPSSPCRTAFPSGISTATAASTKGARWKASIPEAN